MQTEKSIELSRPTGGRLRSVLQSVAGRAVAPTALATAVGYAGICISHLFVLPWPVSALMACVAGITSMLGGVIWYGYRNVGRDFPRAHAWLFTLSILLLVNLSTHMALLKDALQTTHFALVMVGFGFLMLDLLWFTAFVAIYLATWGVLFWHALPAPHEIHFVFLILVATLISTTAHATRYRAVVRIVIERVRSERARKRIERRVKHQQEQLTHAARLTTLGELVAGIAHELNQPLAAIASFAVGCEMRLTRLDGEHVDAQVADYLHQIEDGAVRAGEVLRRLRRLASHSHTDRTCIDFNQVIHDSVRLMSTDVRRRGADILLELEEDLRPVEVDEIQMQQVLVNLLQNGIDASQELGGTPRLKIRTAMSDSELRVSVLDNGPGIEPERCRSMFDPFFTTKDHGMGMGLAICRSIVESHGGKIWCAAHSEAPLAGAAFHVSLPLPKETVDGDGVCHGLHS